MSGRQVPWSSWAEWASVSEGLLSGNAAAISRAVDRVQTWRCRGRLPLGVDITATLLAIQLQDAAVCRSGKFAGATGPYLSELSLQSEYALSIVRLVNGISDSSQKGRVAVSVARQADAAGLPSILVTVRHEATHNHMPSMHLLRLAADHALAWLRSFYWAGQASHLHECSAAIMAVMQRLWTVQASRIVRARTAQTKPSLLIYDADDDDEDASLDAAAASLAETADLNKQRKALLGELKGLLPDACAPTLAAILLSHGAQIHSPPLPAALPAAKGARNAGAPAAAMPQTIADAASVLNMLDRHYLHLALCTVQCAVGAACDALAACSHAAPPPASSSAVHQQNGSGCHAALASGEAAQVTCAALRAAAWWSEVGLSVEARARVGAGHESEAQAAAHLVCLGRVLAAGAWLGAPGFEAVATVRDALLSDCAQESLARIVAALVVAIEALGCDSQRRRARWLSARHAAPPAESLPLPSAAQDAAGHPDPLPAALPPQAAAQSLGKRSSSARSQLPSQADGVAQRPCKFVRVATWAPCTLGMLPTSIPWLGRLPALSRAAPAETAPSDGPPDAAHAPQPPAQDGVHGRRPVAAGAVVQGSPGSGAHQYGPSQPLHAGGASDDEEAALARAVMAALESSEADEAGESEGEAGAADADDKVGVSGPASGGSIDAPVAAPALWDRSRLLALADKLDHD